jgi:hypothetical protein
LIGVDDCQCDLGHVGRLTEPTKTSDTNPWKMWGVRVERAPCDVIDLIDIKVSELRFEKPPERRAEPGMS